jgi:multidrug transporter EmrE-like cation transporter
MRLRTLCLLRVAVSQDKRRERFTTMSLTTYAIIAVIGVLSAFSQYLLKTAVTPVAGHADGAAIAVLVRLATSPALLAAAVLYVTCFGLYLLLLAKADVSQIFPATIGVNILLVAVAAVVMLGESMTVSRVAGMLTIVIGVYLVSRS